MHLRIENLAFCYPSFGFPSQLVLSDINLEICGGEFVGIAGPSGSGKTTLMQHVTRLLKPDEGRVWVDGCDLGSSAINIDDLRRRIGLVFQFPEAQLFEESVFADVAFGLRNLELAENEISERVHRALRQVGLDVEAFGARSPIRLSAGEKRRVALAGILVMNPEVLILDEPTAGLDYPGVQTMIAILKEFHGAGKTVVLISHHLDLLLTLADRVILMNRGKVCFDGAIAKLISMPEVLESAGLGLPRILHFVRYLQMAGWTVPANNRSFPRVLELLSYFRQGVSKQSNG